MNLRRQGVGIKWVKSRNGRVLVEDIAPLIDERTRLLTLSAVQFSNGFRQDLMRTAELARVGTSSSISTPSSTSGRFTSTRAGVPSISSRQGDTNGCSARSARDSSLPALGARPASSGQRRVSQRRQRRRPPRLLPCVRPDAGRFEEALVNFRVSGDSKPRSTWSSLSVPVHREARPRPHVAPHRRPSRAKVPRFGSLPPTSDPVSSRSAIRPGMRTSCTRTFRPPASTSPCASVPSGRRPARTTTGLTSRLCLRRCPDRFMVRDRRGPHPVTESPARP